MSCWERNTSVRNSMTNRSSPYDLVRSCPLSFPPGSHTWGCGSTGSIVADIWHLCMVEDPSDNKWRWKSTKQRASFGKTCAERSEAMKFLGKSTESWPQVTPPISSDWCRRGWQRHATSTNHSLPVKGWRISFSRELASWEEEGGA